MYIYTKVPCQWYLSFNLHAPQEGVRPVQNQSLIMIFNFNPRTPRGGATAIYCKLISRVTTYCRPNVTYLLDAVRFFYFYTVLLLFSRRTSQAFSHSFRFADVVTLLNLLMGHSWFLLRILRFCCYIFFRDSIFANYPPLH